ncbi:chlorophyll A-B binding protein [Fragilaria crotonensis]|nr:chlorophyll A-B binding protein [Fragilaria crotonensis]
MKLAAAILALAGSASAFAPSQVAKTSTALNSLNGWVADSNKFAFGLPGAIAPFEDGFDPLNFAGEADLETLKYYREAETQHGRAAMLAIVGLLVTEEPIEIHPLFEAANKDIGPAIRHLDEVRAVSPFFFEILAVLIGGLELNRALKGWSAPSAETVAGVGTLKADYYPGDIGFDPLGLKPSGAEEFLEISTKELQNGRLAMLGIAGMVAQELINGEEIFVNLGLAQDRFDPSLLPVQF